MGCSLCEGRGEVVSEFEVLVVVCVRVDRGGVEVAITRRISSIFYLPQFLHLTRT